MKTKEKNMVKRILGVALCLALLVVPSFAELGSTAGTATATAQTVTLNAATVVVINNPANTNSMYIRVFWDGETIADATTSSLEVKPGESFTFSRTIAVKAVSIVCAASQTAGYRVAYW